ncbi:MAG: hypothetical protein AB7F89_17425 [Pirellulaceae bacterium]
MDGPFEREPAQPIRMGAEGAHFQLELPAADVSAWEEVYTGRYMPRRIRGSLIGRALG